MSPAPAGLTRTAPARICLAGEGCDWMRSSAANWSFPEVRISVTIHAGMAADRRIVIDYANLSHTEVLGTGHAVPGGRLSYGAACLRVLENAGMHPPGFRMRVSSTIPRCGGLSSSAALCIALVRSMALMSQAELDDTAVAEAAYEAENIMGIPCGRMDQYSIVTPEPVVIDSSADALQVRRLTLRGPISVVVAYNMQASSSFSEQYPLVKSRWEAGDPDIHKYVDVNADICNSLLSESRGPGIDAAMLGECVTRAHQAIVNNLQITNPEIDDWVSAACRAGASGAKSCGARQHGGAMIAICEPAAAAAVASALTAMNASIITWDPHAR
jgi:galactokinase